MEETRGDRDRNLNTDIKQQVRDVQPEIARNVARVITSDGILIEVSARRVEAAVTLMVYPKTTWQSAKSPT